MQTHTDTLKNNSYINRTQNNQTARYGHTLCPTNDATLKPVLTDIVRQEVSRKALGAVALRGVVVSITAEDQHRAAQQRRRVEVPGRAALCEDPPARECENRNAEMERREKQRQPCETSRRSSALTCRCHSVGPPAAVRVCDTSPTAQLRTRHMLT